LSGTAKRVTILPQNSFVGLDVDLLLVVDREAAAFEQGTDITSDLRLSRMRASDIVAESGK
jgi:hypothetical protein